MTQDETPLPERERSPTGAPPPVPSPNAPPNAPRPGGGLTFGTLLFGPTGKVMALAFLVLVLLIPTLMVSSLVDERERRAQSVITGIGEEWGRIQTVAGPFLVVPARVRAGTSNGAPRSRTRPDPTRPDPMRANPSLAPRVEAAIEAAREATPGTPVLIEDAVVIRPRTLRADVRAATDTLSRSIYEARVYEATATLTASFDPPSAAEIGADVIAIDWSKARIAVGLSDLPAIVSATVEVGGRALDGVEPGVGLARAGDAPGFRSPPLDLAQAEGRPEPFEAKVTLVARGSQSVGVAPAGLDSDIRIASDWPHPSFTGVRLPDEREIGDAGFSARWSVPRLALPHAEAWPAASGGGIQPIQRDAVFARLIDPVDHYDRVGRAVKHGMLILVGVFAVAFLLELFGPGALSVVQYLMVGAMIVVFYVLLLALSEHVPFALAYLIAAGASGGVLSAFTGTVIGGRRWGLIAAAAFAVLYATLYAVLGLEDLALLAGAVFTFVLLTIVMFATRKVDWSGRAARLG